MASPSLPSAELPIPDNLTTVQFILDANHPFRPKRTSTPCFVDDESGYAMSLEEVKTRTDRLAVALVAKYGLSDDEVVFLCSPNHIDFPVITWAVHRLGAIVTCANPKSTLEELYDQMKLTSPCLMVAHFSIIEQAYKAASMAGLPRSRVITLGSEGSHSASTISHLIDNCSSLLPPINRVLKPGEGASKIAFLLPSSGTTGSPKAVKIPHRAVIANVVQMALHQRLDKLSQNYGFRNGDNLLGVLPFFHVAGAVLLMHFALFCGMSVIVVGQFDFLRMLKSIAHYRVTNLIIVPPQAVALCKHSAVKMADLSSVKFLAVGAAPTSKEINNELFGVFPSAQIGQIYGTTETPAVVAMVRYDQRRGPVGSAGQLLPGIEALVIRPDGSHARCDESGELYVRGPNISLGYLDQEAATRETFQDGWVRTGDEVILTRDNEVYVIDRIKEFIKVNAYQVSPAEIEGYLLGHPDVLESCVVGIRYECTGEAPYGFVVLTADATQRIKHKKESSDDIKSSIIGHVARGKASHKWLVGIQFVPAIPKTPSGKILRRIFREAYSTQYTKL